MSEKLTLIVFSNKLDKVSAAFNIATGAASMGMEVSIFFTFWGLNVIRKRKERFKPGNIIKRFLKKMNKGGVENLRLSSFHFFGLGTWIMKKLMRNAKMPSMREMISLAKKLGVRFIACNTTMEIMGIGKEYLIPEVDEIAGVATYLAIAKGSKINLFI